MRIVLLGTNEPKASDTRQRKIAKEAIFGIYAHKGLDISILSLT